MGPGGRMRGPWRGGRRWSPGRSDAGGADIGVGEVEVVADDGDERRDGEGREETGEEGEPCQVEGSHVR